jgi:oxaloacetate decarboxylase gamma subunit
MFAAAVILLGGFVENNLISDGIELMLFGMGTVVLFLTLLVFVTTSMSALVERFLPPPPPPASTDSKLTAVISAALHQHRASKTNRDGES